jgi:tetraacyldisaccharide-1-P 4'-kinase
LTLSRACDTLSRMNKIKIKRPKVSTARQQFQVRLSPGERHDIEEAAAAVGLEPSAFVRAVVAAALGRPSPFSAVIPHAFKKR